MRELRQRLLDCLEWYKNCDVCAETLENARRDVRSVFDEYVKDNNIKTDYMLTVVWDDGYLVVKSLDRRLN